VFTLENYFASKLFVAVRETLRKAYTDKEVPHKTTIHRLVARFRLTGSVYSDKRSSSDKTAEVTAVVISSNGIRPQAFNTAIGFVVVFVKEFICSS
jgi:hypothetical protein